MGPGVFLREMAARLTMEDLVYSLVKAAALGAVPAAWLFARDRLFRDRRRSLGFELAATWLCLLVLSAVLGVVASAFEPREEPLGGADVAPDSSMRLWRTSRAHRNGLRTRSPHGESSRAFPTSGWKSIATGRKGSLRSSLSSLIKRACSSRVPKSCTPRTSRRGES
jgi:hypothetical protein